MDNAFLSSVVLPTLTLGLFGWLVPKLLSMVMDEGLRQLMLLSVLSALILIPMSGVFFFFLYLWNGMPLEQITRFGMAENLRFFVRLGLTSSLIWGPIMVLSIAALPRHWTRATW